MDNLNIYQRLAEARELVGKMNIKKAGRNTYSKYDYFTPDQVESIVDKVCAEAGIMCLCNLKADEFGYYQELVLVNPSEPDEESITFQLRTEKGDITATSATQQMGGTDTYSERYIKQKVFQIKDNNLDPDSQDNRGARIK